MKGWIGMVVLAAAGFGCGASANAHLVRSTAGGGTVAVEGSYMDRVAKGMIVMADHCDGEFQILGPDGSPVDSPARDQTVVPFECKGPSLAAAE